MSRSAPIRTSTLRAYARVLTGRPGTREELDAFRDRRLRALVRHAARHVPFYREHFARHDFDPAQVTGVRDLESIPPVSRREIAARPAGDVVARGIDPARLVSHRTSGSTGEPFTILRSRPEEYLLSLFRYRALRRFGMRSRDRALEVGLYGPGDEGPGGVLSRLRHATGLYPAWHISTLRDPDEILAQIRRVRPAVLHAFPVSLARLARHVLERKAGPVPVRIVNPGGEVLTPHMRSQIERAFDGRVCETYGAHEFNILGEECPETGDLHLVDDNVIVEVRKPDGTIAAPGEEGEVVATGLHAFTMPFVRYRLDDLAIQGDDRCACGAPFRTVRGVEGRMLDYFVLPGGRRVHPYRYTVPLLSEAPWLRHYQMTQEAVDRIVFRAVAWRQPDAADIRELDDRARRVFGGDVAFRVELVDRIANEKSGKFRPSRSLVESDYDAVRD